MARRAVEMLLASRHDDAQLHRTIVRVGAACAWAITGVYFVVGLVNADDTIWLQGASPLLASVLMTAQIALDRENAGIALLGCGVISSIWYSLFGSAATVTAMAITTVLMAALWMFFVRSHRVAIAGGLAAVLFVLPLTWPIDDAQKAILAPILAASFIVTHLVLSSFQSAAAEIDSRYQLLFAESPIAVLEEDWSEALDYVRSEYSGKPNRIRQFLLAYPAVVRNAVAKARVLRANDAAIDLLEIRDPKRFIGYRNPSVVTDVTIEPFVDALVHLYEESPEWDAEVPMTTRAGSMRWLQARSMQTPNASQIVIAITDITHLKERHDAMADLVRAKNEFIATVSHELRTPLTAVIGLTTEMADADITGDEQTELMGLVAEQAQEMYNIVDDLLVAARADMGTIAMEITDVDLLEELVTVAEGLGMDVGRPRGDLPPVLADASRLRQVIRNLLTNAQRYGGPQRRVLAGSRGDVAWLEVRDNGLGIPAEDAERIFEPYITGATGVTGSVGLGLSVARQLAELMGGALRYHYEDSESVFRLELPTSGTRQPVLASQAEGS